MELKWCNKCQKQLPITEFWRDRSRQDGLEAYCKNCDRLRSRRYWETYYPKNRFALIERAKANRKDRSQACKTVTCKTPRSQYPSLDEKTYDPEETAKPRARQAHTTHVAISNFNGSQIDVTAHKRWAPSAGKQQRDGASDCKSALKIDNQRLRKLLRDALTKVTADLIELAKQLDE